jgi:DNA (cytosine-5)-methyltransferase 1
MASQQKEQVMLTFGSLFAGVGGFDLGFESAGMTCLWQVENDKYASSVLGRAWRDVPKYGDIKKVSNLSPVDVICFGSPCQDMSVAGKHGGLDGPKRSLFFEAIRIIREMRDATGGTFPKWCVWENVPGAFSSNKGSDFGTVLDTLAESGALVIEWAVLDAQWFGVPQRRRRLFVVACFDPATARNCPDPFLPVGPSSIRDIAASGEKGKEYTDTLTCGLGSGGPKLSDALAGHLITSPTVTSKWGKGTGGLSGDERQNMVVVSVHENQRGDIKVGNVSPTISTGGGKPGQGHQVVMITATATPDSVRRITPLECERLMGWPDNHTATDENGKPISNTQRYKMCGNGVAAPVAGWIGKHIVNATTSERQPSD